MRRDIAVANRKKDEVSEGFQAPESRGPVLHDLEEAVDAFAHGIGERALNEGEDVVEVVTHGGHKGLERG